MSITSHIKTDYITNIEAVKNVLIQSLFINDTSDKRKQKYLAYLHRKNTLFFPWK